VTRKTEQPMTGMYELLDAIESVIASADAAKRGALAKTIDAYCEDFPEEFFWATSAQARSGGLFVFLSLNLDASSGRRNRAGNLTAQ
jgi:hypothetical protein